MRLIFPKNYFGWSLVIVYSDRFYSNCIIVIFIFNITNQISQKLEFNSFLIFIISIPGYDTTLYILLSYRLFFKTFYNFLHEILLLYTFILIYTHLIFLLWLYLFFIITEMYTFLHIFQNLWDLIHSVSLKLFFGFTILVIS